MTVHLLDVNVLVALVDRFHDFHATAERWFAAHTAGGWATCPLTENAVPRIVGHPGYRNPMGAPHVVAGFLREVVARPGHVFWPDDISLLDPRHVTLDRLAGHGAITDTYLLALAVAHGGALATFDRRLPTAAVPGGAAALRVIDTDVPA